MKLQWLGALVLVVSLGAAVPASAQLGYLLKAKQAADALNKAKQLADAAQKGKQILDAAQKAKEVVDAAQKTKQVVDVANRAKEAVDMASRARQAADAAQHAREASEAASRARSAVAPIHSVTAVMHNTVLGPRTWVMRGGYRGYVVPSSFHFGFAFRPVFFFKGAYPCFSSFTLWNGSFTLLDPVPASWPADWYATNDLSINAIDGGGYAATSARFPGVNLSIAASPFTCEHLALGVSVSENGVVEDKADMAEDAANLDQPADNQVEYKPVVQQRIAADPAVEIAYWNSVRDSTDPADLASYVVKYPQGEFVDLAQRRLDKMANPVVAAPVVAPAVASPKLSQTSWAGSIEFTSPGLFMAGHMTRTVGRAGPMNVFFADDGSLIFKKSGTHIKSGVWSVDGTTVTMHLNPSGCRGQGTTFTGSWSGDVIQGTWSEVSDTFMTCGDGAGTFILNVGSPESAKGYPRK